MTTALRTWAPALILAGGAALTFGADRQHSVPLRLPLTAIVPQEIAGLVGQEVTLSPGQQQAAGVTSYLLRLYRPREPAAAIPGFTLYVGYYDSQARGKTIHSPRNCLPGAGWETLASHKATLRLPQYSVTVNRYLVQRGPERALVLYWYQGRGRIEASEYVVKWNLLRDAALRGRTEEALVRVIVPVGASEENAFALGARAAAAVIPGVRAALPT
jgi:EpsI family protein